MFKVWVKNKPELTKVFDTLEQARPYHAELFRAFEPVYIN